MQTYIRNYIKACEAYGWEGGPSFNTDIAEMQNKAEKRNAKWSQSRFFASLPFQNIPQGGWDNIADMFEDRKGRAGTFLYMNRLRNTVEDHVFGVGNGSQDEFQLTYVNSRGIPHNVYALYVPEEDSNGDAQESEVTIYVNDAPTTAVTIDHDRGRVIFDSPPGMGVVLSWSGRFSHWVRFDQDRLPASIDNRRADGYAINLSVDVIEVNPPKPGEIGSSS